ncbi:MAG: polysaccharide deacetylase family protein [Saprospiraceae bacterium]
MLNRPVLIGMFFLTFFVLIAGWFFPIPWYVYVLTFAPFFGSVLYGSFLIDSQVFVPAICKVETSKKIVALTFDDGPEEKVTPFVLDFLKENKVPATFFCIGHKLEKHLEIGRRASDEGHILGNHSYSHSNWFDFFPKKMVVRELNRTEALIKKASHKIPRFFRPPYGVTNFSIADAVDRSKRKGNWLECKIA